MSDCVGDCLIQWIQRAQGMHTPTWQVFEQKTIEALREYQERKSRAISLVEGAQYALLDHNLAEIERKLGELKGLL